jgi:hypothetical protein
MTVMMEMKVCFRFALRYLNPMNHSYLMGYHLYCCLGIFALPNVNHNAVC